MLSLLCVLFPPRWVWEDLWVHVRMGKTQLKNRCSFGDYEPHFSKKYAAAAVFCWVGKLLHSPLLSSLGALVDISRMRVCTTAVLMALRSHPLLTPECRAFWHHHTQADLEGQLHVWVCKNSTNSFSRIISKHDHQLEREAKKNAILQQSLKFTHLTHLGRVIFKGCVETTFSRLFLTGMG